MKSIKYYDENSKEFLEKTKDANMTFLYEKFEQYLNRNDHILDLGCGSGRDSHYFCNKGYEVTSIDGSSQMIDHCNTFLNNRVIHSTFQSFTTEDFYDGIWACASLLHVPKIELKSVIMKYMKYLKNNGVFFMSFKKRESDFEKDGRHFTCFTKYGLKQFLDTVPLMEILKFIETVDVREDRPDEHWITAIIKKVED